MARYEFKLPDIGEGIAEAEIVAWHVKVGDTIGEDQQIADMMTDKATVEMESPVAGKVLELAGDVGDQIPIGSVLAVIETEGADRAVEPVDDSHDERPLADGAVEPTPKMAEEIPVVAADAEAELVRAERRAGRGGGTRCGGGEGGAQSRGAPGAGVGGSSFDFAQNERSRPQGLSLP